MNLMFAVLAKRAYSNVPEGVRSKDFSPAPLTSSVPAFFYMIDDLTL